MRTMLANKCVVCAGLYTCSKNRSTLRTLNNARYTQNLHMHFHSAIIDIPLVTSLDHKNAK